MKRKILWLVIIGAFAGPQAAQAGLILQDTTNATIQLNAFEPTAQSFTAEDSLVSFAFYYIPFNPGWPNDPLRLRLLSGDGLGGAELASFEFSIANDFNGFFDVDLSSIALMVGQQYTAVLDVPGTSPYWGVDINNDGDPYLGGRAYYADLNFDPRPDALDDVRFRVTPKSVPEPGSLVLAGLGLAGLGFSRRKRAQLPSL